MRPESPSDPDPRILALPGGPMAVADVGEGPVFVLLHGLPGSARDFRWLGAALEPTARVLRIELPGFGHSAARPRRSLDGRADAVLEVLEVLGVERYVLLGHSMGGAVAAAVAVRAPSRVRGLALVASPGPVPHRAIAELPLPPWLIAWLLRAPTGRVLRPRVLAHFERIGFRGVTEAQLVETFRQVAATSIPEHAGNLAGLRVPTLVAWAGDDPIVEEAVSERLYWAAPLGPRIRFEEGGHALQATRSSELAEALLAWEPTLEQVAGS